MTPRRLRHTNPKLDIKEMWYRVVADFPQLAHILCIIAGPEGVVSSTMHAVPRADYTIEIEQVKKKKPGVVDVSEFI